MTRVMADFLARQRQAGGVRHVHRAKCVRVLLPFENMTVHTVLSITRGRSRQGGLHARIATRLAVIVLMLSAIK